MSPAQSPTLRKLAMWYTERSAGTAQPPLGVLQIALGLLVEWLAPELRTPATRDVLGVLHPYYERSGAGGTLEQLGAAALVTSPIPPR